METANKSYTIRDRLMRSLEKDTIKIMFKDDLGDFAVECRMMTEDEHIALLRIQIILSMVKTPDDYAKAMKEIHKLLAYPHGICVESSLNTAFWDGGRFSNSLPLKIIGEVAKQTAQRLTESESFRRE